MLRILFSLKAEILDRTIAASESAGEPPLESYRTPGIFSRNVERNGGVN